MIYRTCYGSDAEWAEMMRLMREWAAESMESCSGQFVLDDMTWTVFDDKERFDGADTATVRHHFKTWAALAIHDELPLPQQQSAGVERALDRKCRSPRYRYCVQIDVESLKSALNGSHAPVDRSRKRQAWVKLIDKNGLPLSEQSFHPSRRPDADLYEPIEGVTEYHVGWVKCPLAEVFIDSYADVFDLVLFTIDYCRPPAMVA